MDNEKEKETRVHCLLGWEEGGKKTVARDSQHTPFSIFLNLESPVRVRVPNC